MVLLAVNFDNLHQILQSLYVDMMPLCSQMTGVAKGLAGLGASLLRRLSCLAVIGKSRAYRCLSAPASLCSRTMHHVFPDLGVGHTQQRNVAHRDGNTQNPRNADL